MTEAQLNLMKQVWVRGCDYSHLALWADVYGVSEYDIPSEEDFAAYCRTEDEAMDEFFRQEIEFLTEEIE